MKALVYCEGEFGKIDGKVANGLARHSEKYMARLRMGLPDIRKSIRSLELLIVQKPVLMREITLME